MKEIIKDYQDEGFTLQEWIIGSVATLLGLFAILSVAGCLDAIYE